jgi:2-keto-3-deoxy-6-phosphogluconate aldolase
MGGVPLWASGGVEIDQIPAYLRLGVKAVGLTGALFPQDALARRDMDSIREKAIRAAQAAATVVAGAVGAD